MQDAQGARAGEETVQAPAPGGCGGSEPLSAGSKEPEHATDGHGEQEPASSGHEASEPSSCRHEEQEPPEDSGSATREAEAKRISHDLNELLRYWASRKQELLPLAGEQFISFVDPAFLYGMPPLIGRESFSIMFTEWMLFEFAYLGGSTPAELFIAQPPAGTDPACLARLRCAVRTQVFSRFIIRDKHAESGMAALEDIQTARRYDVYDPALCANDDWRNGTIGERLACVDGLWLPIGLVRLYDRAAPSDTAVDGPGFFHPEDRSRKPEAEHASFYLRLVRDIIGIDGRYRHTTTMVSGGASAGAQ